MHEQGIVENGICDPAVLLHQHLSAPAKRKVDPAPYTPPPPSLYLNALWGCMSEQGHPGREHVSSTLLLTLAGQPSSPTSSHG